MTTNDVDAMELHELYKQRSTSETWIEQVKGHVMSGSTLTDDFWANDILWQLSVLAYNVSVMMRHKKGKFRKQEYENQHQSIWARYVQIAQKAGKFSGIYAKRTKDTKYSKVELNQIGHD